jgi:putative transposase
MKKEEKFDFEAFAKEAADQLRQKKPLTGKDGVFTPLINLSKSSRKDKPI